MRRVACVVLLLMTGCASLAGVSSGKIGCAEDEIAISDENRGYSSATWVASCRGQRFFCSATGTRDISCAPEMQAAPQSWQVYMVPGQPNGGSQTQGQITPQPQPPQGWQTTPQPPPPVKPPPPTSWCNPICSPGFECQGTVCVPLCNPACGAGTKCGNDRTCQPLPSTPPPGVPF